MLYTSLAASSPSGKTIHWPGRLQQSKETPPLHLVLEITIKIYYSCAPSFSLVLGCSDAMQSAWGSQVENHSPVMYAASRWCSGEMRRCLDARCWWLKGRNISWWLPPLLDWQLRAEYTQVSGVGTWWNTVVPLSQSYPASIQVRNGHDLIGELSDSHHIFNTPRIGQCWPTTWES